jgi:hypothetical protein
MVGEMYLPIRVHPLVNACLSGGGAHEHDEQSAHKQRLAQSDSRNKTAVTR